MSRPKICQAPVACQSETAGGGSANRCFTRPARSQPAPPPPPQGSAEIELGSAQYSLDEPTDCRRQAPNYCETSTNVIHMIFAMPRCCFCFALVTSKVKECKTWNSAHLTHELWVACGSLASPLPNNIDPWKPFGGFEHALMLDGHRTCFNTFLCSESNLDGSWVGFLHKMCVIFQSGAKKTKTLGQTSDRGGGDRQT